MEWWSFELFSLMSSYLGVIQNSALLLTFSYCVLFWMIALGFQIASQCLIGNTLGSRESEKGKRYFKIIAIMATTSIVIYASIAYSFRKQLAAALTVNEELRQVLEETYRVFIIMMITDGTQGWLGGVIRGLNLQQKGSVVCFITYYPLNLPISYLLGFTGGMGAYGLYLGVSIAQIFQIIAFLVLIYRVDWEKES